MSSELSQLDQLIESDVLDALGKNPKALEIELSDDEDTNSFTSTDYDGILIEDFIDENNSQNSIESEQLIEEEENLYENENESAVLLEKSSNEKQQIIQELSGTNLAQLLSELLNNKTIEITIKIKD